jgi:hypothetical protein
MKCRNPARSMQPQPGSWWSSSRGSWWWPADLDRLVGYRHVPSGTRIGKAAEQQQLQLMLRCEPSLALAPQADTPRWGRVGREQRERGKEDNGETSWRLERSGSRPTRPVLWSRGLHSQATGRCGRRRRASQANKSAGVLVIQA